MKIIDGIAHVVLSINLADNFNKDVCRNIKGMQDIGLEVEVQYQQSDNAVSALIIGRKDK